MPLHIPNWFLRTCFQILNIQYEAADCHVPSLIKLFRRTYHLLQLPSLQVLAHVLMICVSNVFFLCVSVQWPITTMDWRPAQTQMMRTSCTSWRRQTGLSATAPCRTRSTPGSTAGIKVRHAPILYRTSCLNHANTLLLSSLATVSAGCSYMSHAGRWLIVFYTLNLICTEY